MNSCLKAVENSQTLLRFKANLSELILSKIRAIEVGTAPVTCIPYYVYENEGKHWHT